MTLKDLINAVRLANGQSIEIYTENHKIIRVQDWAESENKIIDKFGDCIVDDIEFEEDTIFVYTSITEIDTSKDMGDESPEYIKAELFGDINTVNKQLSTMKQNLEQKGYILKDEVFNPGDNKYMVTFRKEKKNETR